MRGTIVQRIPTAKNGASANSSVTCAVSCIMQLVCAHTWLYNIRWSSPKRSASGQHRKLRCDAVLRELNLKSVNNGRRYHEGPPRRGGQAPTRLRQARMIKKIATTRGVTRCHKYSAKCSALPQQISQEMFEAGNAQDQAHADTRQEREHMLLHTAVVRAHPPALEVFAAKSTAYGRVLRARVWFCANEMIGKSVQSIRESTCGVDRWKCIGNPLYVSSKCFMGII